MWVDITIQSVASSGYEYRKAMFNVLTRADEDVLGIIEWDYKKKKYIFVKHEYEKVKIGRKQKNYIKDFLEKLGDRDEFEYTVYGLGPIRKRHKENGNDE